MSVRLHAILSLSGFAAVWLALILVSSQDSRTDVDLGIATSQLSLWDNALWCLPLTLMFWLAGEAILAWLHWKSQRTGRASR